MAMTDPLNKVNTATDVTTTVVNGEIVGGQAPVKKSNGFLKVLGTIGRVGVGIMTGGGIGGVIPQVLGGNTSYLGGLQAMHNDQIRSQVQLIGFQQKVNRQSEEFAAITNLLKTRHDSEMQAINNIKS